MFWEVKIVSKEKKEYSRSLRLTKTVKEAEAIGKRVVGGRAYEREKERFRGGFGTIALY